MASIYDFKDYRVFLQNWIDSHPSGARGLKSELAEVMGISTSLMSQILGGTKNLSSEQASELAERLSLNDAETDYFFLLVDHARAGTPKLRKRLENKMFDARKQAQKAASHVQKNLELNEEQKGTYYSSWVYSGARLLSALDSVRTAEDLAKRMQLPLPQITKVVQFLLDHGLCRIENGQLTYGPATTFVDNESAHVVKHHRNWRLRGMSAMDAYNESDLFLTYSMGLSKELFAELRTHLLAQLKEINQKVAPSPSEMVACMNIDLFEFAAENPLRR